MAFENVSKSKILSTLESKNYRDIMNTVRKMYEDSPLSDVREMSGWLKQKNRWDRSYVVTTTQVEVMEVGLSRENERLPFADDLLSYGDNENDSKYMVTDSVKITH